MLQLTLRSSGSAPKVLDRVQTPTRFRLQPRDRGDTLSVSLVIRCPDFWPRVLQQRQTAACRSPHIDLRAQNACCRATRQIAARSERQADAAVTDRPPVRRQPSSPAAADRTAHVKPLPATAFGSSGKAGTLQHPGPIDRWSQKCPQFYSHSSGFPTPRRQATALRTTCRATESPAEFEEATELDEQDDQSGAGYDVPDELLRLIAPSTVPTPIFDSEEVCLGALPSCA